MPLLSYPTEGVDVDSTGLLVSWTKVHWSCNQKDISDAILVDIQPTHLTAVVRSNLQMETCSFSLLPEGGVLALSRTRFPLFCSLLQINKQKYRRGGGETHEESFTCSPLRACTMLTSPSSLSSNRMTLPLCLNRGAPATYSLLQSPTITEDTV